MAATRSRAVRDAQRWNPKRVPVEYYEMWEKQLSAQGRPWGWIDVGTALGLHRYKSLFRAFLILGQLEETLNEGETAQTQLDAVHGMKTLRQFVLDGQWATGWRFANVADSVQKLRTAGAEIELEAALGAIKVEKELKKRIRGILSEKPESDSGTNVPSKAKAKGKAR